ncbi:hypothetical protein C8R46DRAFT_1040201 [Mycena filopes]|nr:hypothetical protein C8R46DRAFT_1040201 [Mycena filopes]
MAPNSRCGLPLPLPVDFDTTAHMTRPADIPATPGFDLGDINAENVRLEKLNKISIAYTRAFAAARASPTGINNLDVGAMLEPFLAYSDADKELLVGSEAVVAATGPLPTYMTLWVAGVRIAEAQKNQKEKARRDKEKSDAIAAKTALPIFGTLEMVNPQVVGGTLSSVTSIPVLWHSSLFYKVYFPLHWWSDATLERATNYPHTFHTESITTATSSTGVATTVRVLNVNKMLKVLGEEESAVMTPGLWRRASLNQLASFEKICKPVDPTNPASFSTAVEYGHHINHFSNLRVFEDLDLFPVWYRVELDLRYKIVNNGLYSAQVYEQQISIALSTHHYSLANPISRPSAPPFQSGLKRPPGDDGNAAPPKGPRFGNGARGGNNNPSTSGERPPSAPSCLVCTGPHSALNHPAGKTSFDDGASHFTGSVGRDLQTLQSFRGPQRRQICIQFNLARPCEGNHPERLHVCSLCGGSHAALSRDPSCKRVRAGAFVP